MRLATECEALDGRGNAYGQRSAKRPADKRKNGDLQESAPATAPFLLEVIARTIEQELLDKIKLRWLAGLQWDALQQPAKQGPRPKSD